MVPELNTMGLSVINFFFNLYSTKVKENQTLGCGILYLGSLSRISRSLWAILTGYHQRLHTIAKFHKFSKFLSDFCKTLFPRLGKGAIFACFSDPTGGRMQST